jgi:hypothetical protein
MPSGALDFGGGLAKGLATVFGNQRAAEDQKARDTAAQRAAFGRDLLPEVLKRLKSPDDLPLVMPYLDEALGTTGAKFKKGEIDPRDFIMQALGPAFSGAGSPSGPASSGEAVGRPAAPAPGVGAGAVTPATPAQSDEAVVRQMFAPRPNASTVAEVPVTAQTPPVAQTPGAGGSAAVAPAAAPAKRPGLQLLSDAELIERNTSNEAVVANATMQRQTKLARDIYDQFKDLDDDFTLYDALAMAGFRTDYNRQYASGAAGQTMRGLDAQIQRREAELGRTLTADEALEERAKYFAQSRSVTDREAISREKYGVATNLLTPEQQADVNATYEAQIGNRAYRRTAAGNEADFNAPLTPAQAQASNLPVGTTGAQVAGQSILKDAEVEQRRTTESLRDTLTDIDTRLIDAALPDENELAGKLPGAASEIRRRTTHRNEFAALEAAVDNIVNVAARVVAGAKGAQSEADAKRAENAVVGLKNSIFDPLAGDTRQSAKARIKETLKIVNEVLAKLPTQATPGTPQTPAPRADGKRVSGSAPAPAAPAAAAAAGGRPGGTGGFGVTHAGKYYTFPSQAALDAFKRGLKIP